MLEREGVRIGGEREREKWGEYNKDMMVRKERF